MPDNEILVLLRQARNQGFSTIPVSRDKRPMIAWKTYQERKPTNEELNNWWSKSPDAWAIITGAISGVVVLDFDGDSGLETLRRLELRPHVKTGSGGAHVYFRHPGFPIKTVSGQVRRDLGELYRGLDVRGDGGYVIFAGRNERGSYEWVRNMEPDLVTMLPADLQSMIGIASQAPRAPVTSLSDRVSDDVLIRSALDRVHAGLGRNETGFWLAIQLRDNGFSEYEALATMSSFRGQVPVINAKGHPEPYTDVEVRESIKQAFSRTSRNPWIPQWDQNGHSDKGTRQDTPVFSESGTLPTIIAADRELRDISKDTLEALRTGNDPPELFIRSGQMVNVIEDEDGRHSIREVTEAFLRGRMSRTANFCRTFVGRNDGQKIPTSPPIDVVRDVLALAPTDWRFPALETVTESPVLRSDGTIFRTAGYDSSTRTVYAPSAGLHLPPIPDDPITDEVVEAVSVIQEAVEGFPFVDDASRANAYAMMLTPMLRKAIQGNAPIALVDAPEAGTGKSLLTELVAIIHTGAAAAMKPAPSRDEEEWRKTLSAVLLAGNPLTIFDNVTHRLESPSLALAVTASTWTDRILGQSRTITIPQRTTWIVTGNNIVLGGDLPRRCYWIRLDAATPRPWQRSGFKIADLRKWVHENRGRLLGALLVISRAWFSAGRPESSTPVLGSFEHWSRTIGGILAYARIEGFLGNLENLYEQSDPSTQQWESFLTAIREEYGELSFTIHDLVELIRKGDPVSKSLPDDLPEDDRKGSSFQRRIASSFRSRVGRRFGTIGLHLLRAGDARNKVALWIVKAQTTG
jgi:hypothetical protein